MIRRLAPMSFGDRETREKWERECKELKRASGLRDGFIVAPRNNLSTELGVMLPGSVVTEAHFVGFSAAYPDEPKGIPLRPDQALARAVECGVVIDCSRR